LRHALPGVGVETQRPRDRAAFGDERSMTSEYRDYTDVSVVMITRNEEEAIAKVVDDARSALPGCEVIVVDGSSDRTAEIATAHGARVFREPVGGPAPALLYALRASTRPIVVTVDADDTYPPEIYPELVRRVREGDDVAGTNRLGRRPPKAMPLRNWVANILFNVVASAHATRVLRDVHSGQRAYRREILDRFDWDTTGRAFPVDLLLWPAIAGCRISEVEIPYRDRIGETTLNRWIDGRETLRRLFRRVKPRIH
jgi:glycosyltransferase involved in cell wall biosynthesis